MVTCFIDPSIEDCLLWFFERDTNFPLEKLSFSTSVDSYYFNSDVAQSLEKVLFLKKTNQHQKHTRERTIVIKYLKYYNM